MQHTGPDRVPFGVIGVQQALGRRLLDHLGQLPPQVHGILHARVEALAALWGMYVRGVPRQKDPTVAVGDRLPGHVGESGDPGRAVHAEVGPVGGNKRLTEVRQRGVTRVFELLLESTPPGTAHRPLPG